jgi:nucleosome binding factor SPN SPT16 subunit
MADDIAIDKQLFQDRLSSFVAQWKAEKRSSDALFSGVNSIVILVGKASESGTYFKSAAFQVISVPLEGSEQILDANCMQLWLLGYEFPATLFLITHDTMHIVTTKKKGM